jgi:hypothetical protein
MIFKSKITEIYCLSINFWHVFVSQMAKYQIKLDGKYFVYYVLSDDFWYIHKKSRYFP